MASLNKVLLIGYLGGDPDQRFTSGGTAVCNFSMATSRKWTDASGKTQEDTQWHKIVVWGKSAENCKKYLSKGSLVLIEGRLQTRQWEDKEGNKRYTTEVVSELVTFLNSKGDNSGGKHQEDVPPPNNSDVPF